MIPASTLFLLLATTLFTSAVSGMTGMAGGMLLLSVMASVVQAEYIIPLHAAVQLMSNSARTVLFFRHIRWRIVALFSLGMLPGAAIGIVIFGQLNEHAIKLSMGVFILSMAFVSMDGKAVRRGFGIFVPVGFAAGLLGIFFGAIRPLIARFFLRSDIAKEELVATKAACQWAGHLIKIPLFGFIGANVLVFGRILVYLCCAVVIGTLFGKWMLHRISEKTFSIAFRLLLAAIALRIVILELFSMAG